MVWDETGRKITSDQVKFVDMDHSADSSVSLRGWEWLLTFHLAG